MGKYMRKSKSAGEVALLEVTHAQSFSGVRTRGKTLALQLLQPSSAGKACSGGAGDGGSYLQLRSRRLQKPPIGSDSRRHKPFRRGTNPSPRANSQQNQSTRLSWASRQGSSANSGFSIKDEKRCLDGVKKVENVCGAVEENENKNSYSAGCAGGQASFGDNFPQCEGRERTTRETTPCSWTRDSVAMRSHDMNEFFAGAEEEHQRQFIEKYNFDPVNEKPLPGRFEWEKLNPYQ